MFLCIYKQQHGYDQSQLSVTEIITMNTINAIKDNKAAMLRDNAHLP